MMTRPSTMLACPQPALLLLLLLLLPLPALAGTTAVLQQLGVVDALEGFPAVLELATAARDEESRTSDPVSVDTLLRRVVARVEAEVASDQRDAAAALLSSALARRARGRVEAAAGPDQFQRVAAYREQLRARPPLPARRELLQQLVVASRSAELAAALQGLAEALLDPAGEHAHGVLAARQAARSEVMQPVLEDYYLYVYRHLRNEELRQYHALLREAPVQAMLEAVLQALVDPALAEPGRAADP